MSGAASWLSRFLPRASTAGAIARTPDEIERLWRSLFGSGVTHSGAEVNAGSAMRVAAVYACVRVLADSVGMLDAMLQTTDANGRTAHARDHAVDKILRTRPNQWQTPIEFKRMLMGHICLRGNAYAQIVRLGGKVQALIPLHPDRMHPRQLETGKIEYHYSKAGGQKVVFAQAEIMHLRNLSVDGLMGISPIEAAREAVGLALQTEKHGAKLFSNAATPSGVLTTTGKLSDEAIKRLGDQFDERYASADNAHRTMVLEEGLSWTKLGLTAVDSQFLESRKFQRNEIAMFYGVPPHMIGDIDRGTSWGSGIEQQGIGFVTYTLLPHLVNFSQAVNRDLLTDAERMTHAARFDTEPLTRADFLTRQQGLQIMRNAGVINANEWRMREGMNPRGDSAGDDYSTGPAVPIAPRAPNEGRTAAHAA